MIKYYFGYNILNGLHFPFKWMEDRGQAVGGTPTAVVDKVEITLQEFNFVGLTELVRRYPRKVDEGESPSPR